MVSTLYKILVFRDEKEKWAGQQPLRKLQFFFFIKEAIIQQGKPHKYTAWLFKWSTDEV